VGVERVVYGGESAINHRGQSVDQSREKKKNISLGISAREETKCKRGAENRVGPRYCIGEEGRVHKKKKRLALNNKQTTTSGEERSRKRGGKVFGGITPPQHKRKDKKKN